MASKFEKGQHHQQPSYLGQLVCPSLILDIILTASSRKVVQATGSLEMKSGEQEAGAMEGDYGWSLTQQPKPETC